MDGSWDDLQRGLYDSASAEVAIAVLVLAGLTDGAVERDGRPCETCEPAEQKPHPYSAWIVDDANAPDLRSGMKIEANPARPLRQGDMVACRPGRIPDYPFIGRYEVTGRNRRVLTNPDMEAEHVLTPAHEVAVVEWVVKEREVVLLAAGA